VVISLIETSHFFDTSHHDFHLKNAIASSILTLPAMLLAAYRSGFLHLMIKHSL